MTKIIFGLLLLLQLTLTFSQENIEEVDLSEVNDASEQSSSEKVANETADKNFRKFLKTKTKIKDPFNLRDPFRSPLKIKKKSKLLQRGILKDGVFTNTASAKGVPLSKLKITGVLVGKERRAIARIGNETVILKEGMTLGEDGALLKAILPGGIILVEKILNVYGEDEYLETVIPISSD